jgi:hypothetical protein
MNQQGDYSGQHDRQAKLLAHFITGFLDQTLSGTEQQQLAEWVGESDANLQLFIKLTDKKNIDQALEQFKGLVPEAIIENIKQRIHF